MKTKVKFLLSSGLTKNTLMSLSESKINILYEKFKNKEKKETKETTMVSKDDIPTQTKLKSEKKPFEVYEKNEMSEVDDTLTQASIASQGKTANNPAGYDPDQDIPTEGEIKEKFESQAQRNFFWAKCNTSKGVKKQKWCEMAREFEDSTSEEQSETMPKKKHPEKTVKYKKEKTNENLQKFIENTIVEMLEKKVDARMTKKDLLEAIKKSKKSNDSFVLRKPKKVTMFSDEAPMELPIAKMFSIGKSKK